MGFQCQEGLRGYTTLTYCGADTVPTGANGSARDGRVLVLAYDILPVSGVEREPAGEPQVSGGEKEHDGQNMKAAPTIIYACEYAPGLCPL